MRKIATLLIAVFMITSLFSCGGNGAGKGKTTLPPVVTTPINDREKVTSEIKIDGFDIDIYTTYSAVKGYDGESESPKIPDSATGVPVRVIKESAFDGNEKIKSVTFGKNVLVIERYAFRGTSKLEKVILNDGLESIGDWSFENSAIKECVIPDSVSAIGKYAFRNTGLTVANVPENAETVGKYCFADCSLLESVTFTARIDTLSENMFSDCPKLKISSVPENVTKIGAYAFRNCASLDVITFEGEIEKVGEGAFYGCKITEMTGRGEALEDYAEANGINFKRNGKD